MPITTTEILLRLFMAVFLGALLGMERQHRHKPAGLRTHIMVSLGSAAFVLMGVEFIRQAGVSAAPAEAYTNISRILQGVAGGLGFLGAGTILRDHGTVTGLTTAAGVWVVGAIGAACGLGLYSLACVTTAFAVAVLWLLLFIEHPAESGPGAPGRNEPL
jgi:putative Mg2+ transporter-C (MgtC) family protein